MGKSRLFFLFVLPGNVCFTCIQFLLLVKVEDIEIVQLKKSNLYSKYVVLMREHKKSRDTIFFKCKQTLRKDIFDNFFTKRYFTE